MPKWYLAFLMRLVLETSTAATSGTVQLLQSTAYVL